jgi:hypothetical protein
VGVALAVEGNDGLVARQPLGAPWMPCACGHASSCS